MKKYEDYINANQAFIFELDNVLYPEKDYQLQVYYLFAQFIEYGEQTDAQEIIHFMEETYFKEGKKDIFEKTATRFGLPEKYKINFDLLQQNAKLPLKLLLFAPVLDFMKEIRDAGKFIFLLVEGDPAQQLNKIKQIEWNGLEQSLIVYFSAETISGSFEDTLDMIILKHELKREGVLLAGQSLKKHNTATSGQIKFLPIDKLYLP